MSLIASVKATQESKWSDFPTCTQILHLMVILGFMFNYMLRVNLNIAIVAMVTKNNETLTTDSSSSMQFKWDEAQKNDLLGSFFWGYLLTEVPGGRLAEIIGGKRVIGAGMLLASVLTLLMPIACNIHYFVALVMRLLLGLCLGATWPATLPLAANWIPPLKRSRFMAQMMASSLGAALTLPLCGFLIATCGWPSVFYVTGAIGFLWSVTWWFTVYDSPAKHPRITQTERESIESKMMNNNNSQRNSRPSSVPWLKILGSTTVWAIIVVHVCNVFGFFTLITQLPTYLDRVLQFNIKKNGLLSSIPYIGNYIMANIAGFAADYLLKSGRLSLTKIRKLFTGLAVSLPGLLMAVQALFGSNATVSVAVFTLALWVNGAVTAGYLANGLDIAPHFSGTIFGIANTLSSLGGWLSTRIVAIVTISSQGQAFEQWRTIFWILSGMYCFGALIFIIFATAELQSWNHDESTTKSVSIESHLELSTASCQGNINNRQNNDNMEMSSM